jgi:hypothetical protein
LTTSSTISKLFQTCFSQNRNNTQQARHIRSKKQIQSQIKFNMVENKNSIGEDSPIIIDPIVHATISNERSNAAADDTDLLLFVDADSVATPPPPQQQGASRVVDTPNPPTPYCQAVPLVPVENVERAETTVGVNKEEATPRGAGFEKHDQLVRASGIAGGVVGLLLGGPILALVAGFGSAYAIRKENTVGDISRSMGEVALTIEEKARQVNQKHHIADKTKATMDDLEDRFCIARKARQLVITSWKAGVDFTRQRNLIERGIEGTGHGFEYLADKFAGKNKNTSDTDFDYAGVPSDADSPPQHGGDGTFY